jgi:hypothetical protein
MKYVSLPLACALIAALLNPVSAHEGAESTGVGDVKFGMSPDEVKKLYPNLELVMSPPPPVEGKPDLRMSVYRLKEHRLGKLTCNIEFKFLADLLSYADFYCGEKEDVPAYLEATYGKPSTSGSTGWQWQGPKIIVSYAPAIGTFSVTNKRSNDALQGNMFLYQMIEEGKQLEKQQAPAQQ